MYLDLYSLSLHSNREYLLEKCDVDILHILGREGNGSSWVFENIKRVGYYEVRSILAHCISHQKVLSRLIDSEKSLSQVGVYTSDYLSTQEKTLYSSIHNNIL